MAGPKQLQNLRVSNRSLNSTNVPIEVAVLDGSGNQITSFGSGGTQYTEGDIDATITGTVQLFEGPADTLFAAQGSTSVAPESSLVGLIVRFPAPLTDSTNNALRVFQVASSGGASSTEVTARQSTYTDFNTLTRLADRDASTNVANITNTTPASTAYGLVIRDAVPQSTIVTVSTGSVRVHQSTAADLNVTVAGYSTLVAVSSLAGQVSVGEYSTGTPGAGSTGLIVRLPAPLFDSTNNALRMFQVASSGGASSTETTVRQSTYTDFNTLSRLADRDASTNVAAILNATPASTAYGLVVRLPAPLTDSTNNAVRVFQVASSASAGSTETTVRQSTFTDFNGLMRLADRDLSTNVAGIVNTEPASTVYGLTVRQVGYVAPSTVISISTGSMRVHQSTAADLNVTVAGYVAPSTLTTVRQSTYTDFNTLSRLADRDASTNVAAVLNAAPASTAYALVVREVAHSTGPFALSSIAGRTLVDQNSTVWAVQVDGRVRAQNSTIGDLLASVQQNSTVWAVQVDGRVRAQNSTIGDLLASVQQNSTVWQTQSRVTLPTLLSTAFSTLGNNSTSSTVVSSAAGVRHKVYAYSITSTVQAVNTLTFASSLANALWHVQMQAFSSGISGANLAVSPPAWLFATEAANPLVFKVTGTTGTYHVSFSYFSEA